MGYETEVKLAFPQIGRFHTTHTAVYPQWAAHMRAVQPSLFIV